MQKMFIFVIYILTMRANTNMFYVLYPEDGEMNQIAPTLQRLTSQ